MNESKKYSAPFARDTKLNGKVKRVHHSMNSVCRLKNGIRFHRNVSCFECIEQ